MRIVILFAKAGGGHQSAAKALKAQMLKQNPNLVIELIDILTQTSQWQQDLFCASYVFFTDKVPLVWSFLQILWKIDLFAQLTAIPLKIGIQKTLEKIIDSRPDKIICTYFLIDLWLNEIQNSRQIPKESKEINEEIKTELKNLNQSKIPIWTVVTDIFSPHSVWFLGKNCNYLVFSESAKLAAQNRGVLQNKIAKFGVFFGEKFEKVGTKLEIENWKDNLLTAACDYTENDYQNQNLPKNNLDLPEKIKNQRENSQTTLAEDSSNNSLNKLQIQTLLVVGGGESMPNGIPILQNLLDLEIHFNLVFVCGRNENLRQKCQKIVQKWYKNNPKFHKNIQIIGFTKNLYELINIADLVICKAGPATILELISQQKPFLISHFIWEQEIGNRDFAVSGGVAIYENNPKKLAQKVQELFYDKEKLDKLTKNYDNLQIQNDLTNITKFLIQK